ncbi:unnamed protein product, partial [Brassica rapa]
RAYQLGDQWNPTDLFLQHYKSIPIYRSVELRLLTVSAVLQCLRARETP